MDKGEEGCPGPTRGDCINMVFTQSTRHLLCLLGLVDCGRLPFTLHLLILVILQDV